jgi:hypothetical protein
MVACILLLLLLLRACFMVVSNILLPHAGYIHVHRAAAAGRTGNTATAPALIARSHATSTSLKGIMSAEDRTGDIFQNIVTSNIVATPPGWCGTSV